MVKIKFSTFMEVDLDGMSTQELLDLKKQVDIRVNGRINPQNITLAVVLQKDNNCHTRLGYAIEKIVGKSITEIKLSELPEKISLKQLQEHRNLGNRSIEHLNNIMLQHGFSAIHN